MAAQPEDVRSALGVRTVPEGKVTVVTSEGVLRKAEDGLLRSQAIEAEDKIAQLFTSDNPALLIVVPTYEPWMLATLAQQNNTLASCVHAMEVNVDATGYDIERADGEEVDDEEAPMGAPKGKPKVKPGEPKPGVPPEKAVEKLAGEPPKDVPDAAPEAKAVPADKPDDSEVERIRGFFDEPYPGMTLSDFRRSVRRDLEITGNAYVEVIRNQGGEITFLNRLPATHTRLVRLDDPVVIEKTIKRNGKDATVKLIERERRYVMAVGQKKFYFKQFGSQRKLDAITGAWEGTGPEKASTTNGVVSGTTPGVPPLTEATEVIHLMVNEDVLTPYGVPRWINQLPSVLGSRRAEEYNLQFFNSGGIPPALIILEGGSLSPEARQNLTNYLAGGAHHKQRAVVVEMYSNSGSMDGSPGQVRAKVERFGAEKQDDSMFENYDKRCAERVRMAFRLPPMFLGLNEDYNFATAQVSYMVAEAQVFKPERDEFDEMINTKIMPELAPEYKFRSLPLAITDIETKLKAMELAKDIVEGEGFVDAINESADLSLVFDHAASEMAKQKEIEDGINQQLGLNPVKDEFKAQQELDYRDSVQEAEKNLSAKQKAKEAAKRAKLAAQKKTRIAASEDGLIAKVDDAFLQELGDDFAAFLSGDKVFTPDGVGAMRGVIKSMAPPLRKLFNAYVGQKLGKAVNDSVGFQELIACAGDCVSDGSDSQA